MTDNTVPWFQRLWGTMEEPRTITALMVFFYTVAVGAAVGFAIVPTPHPLPHSNFVLQVLAVGLLGLGGLIGAPTAWLGKWWLERACATACLGGMFVLLFDVAVLLHPQKPNLAAPVLTLTAVLFSMGLWGTRILRINGQPYAPGRGPETPEMQADKLLAHIIAEDHEHQGWANPTQT